MDIKLKYRAWVGEKHADIASPLINSDIETFAIEFVEWLVKNCFIPDVVGRSEQFACLCPRTKYDDCDREMPCKECEGCKYFKVK